MAVTLASGVSTAQTTAAQTIPRVNRRNAPQRAYAIIITATITVAIQGSIDGTNYVNLVSGKTASEGGLVTLMPFMRVVTSSPSGTPSATVVIDVDA